MPYVTQTALAVYIDMTRETISDHVARGTIKKRADGKYDLQECIRGIIRWQSAKLSGRIGNEELAAQRVNVAREQAESISLKNAIARGDYVWMATVERVLGEMFAVLREIALCTPGKVADTAAEAFGGDRALAFRIIDDEIREMLELLSAPDVVTSATGLKQ
jgi:phage terminase Nu1 subunit (DNA packaging protein)